MALQRCAALRSAMPIRRRDLEKLLDLREDASEPEPGSAGARLAELGRELRAKAAELGWADKPLDPGSSRH
jgi:hypothetical protein